MAKTSGNIRRSHINQDAINKARAILENFDWHWHMADYAYTREESRAKAQMRAFVDYANKAGSKKMTKKLRDEWTSAYTAALKERQSWHR